MFDHLAREAKISCHSEWQSVDGCAKVFTMRKSLAVLLILIGSFCMFAPLAGGNDNPQVCAGTHITPAPNTKSVTLTAPEGQLISGYCVKAGSLQQGNGPVYVTVDPPAKTVTITHPSGKNISHYTVTFVTPSTTTTEGTTTTTEPDATTTTSSTVPETTTTSTTLVEETTTTAQETTTTLVPVDIGTATTLERLPATGVDTPALIFIGVLLVLLGWLLLSLRRM